MARQRLDPKILNKMAHRKNTSVQYMREQISRKAGREGISAEAAQVILARQLGIGTASVLRRLAPHIQQEVRTGLQGNENTTPIRSMRSKPAAPERRNGKAKFAIKSVVDQTLLDAELRDRCRDLLSARKHYDRAMREATTVLDDRLKKLSGIKNMNPAPLVAKVLNGDPSKAIIVVSTEPNEQQGFYNMCSGVMLAFRDNTHHNLSDKFTQADALKFCGLIDMLLAVIGKGTIHPERAPGAQPGGAASAP